MWDARNASYALDPPGVDEVEGFDLFHDRTEELRFAAAERRRTALLDAQFEAFVYAEGLEMREGDRAEQVNLLCL
jgi:hypothetical protein